MLTHAHPCLLLTYAHALYFKICYLAQLATFIERAQALHFVPTRGSVDVLIGGPPCQGVRVCVSLCVCVCVCMHADW